MFSPYAIIAAARFGRQSDRWIEQLHSLRIAAPGIEKEHGLLLLIENYFRFAGDKPQASFAKQSWPGEVRQKSGTLHAPPP